VKPEPKDKNALRITDQFRTTRGMVYDLRCYESRLSVCIGPRNEVSDPADWRVEAWSGRIGEGAVVTEWGRTKALALSAAGHVWAEQTRGNSLPAFDWDAVAKALNDVRAL